MAASTQNIDKPPHVGYTEVVPTHGRLCGAVASNSVRCGLKHLQYL